MLNSALFAFSLIVTSTLHIAENQNLQIIRHQTKMHFNDYVNLHRKQARSLQLHTTFRAVNIHKNFTKAIEHLKSSSLSGFQAVGTKLNNKNVQPNQNCKTTMNSSYHGNSLTHFKNGKWNPEKLSLSNLL